MLPKKMNALQPHRLSSRFSIHRGISSVAGLPSSPFHPANVQMAMDLRSRRIQLFGSQKQTTTPFFRGLQFHYQGPELAEVPKDCGPYYDCSTLKRGPVRLICLDRVNRARFAVRRPEPANWRRRETTRCLGLEFLSRKDHRRRDSERPSKADKTTVHSSNLP